MVKVFLISDLLRSPACVRRGRGLRQFEEDLFEADRHRPQLVQIPAGLDDGAGHIGSHHAPCRLSTSKTWRLPSVSRKITRLTPRTCSSRCSTASWSISPLAAFHLDQHRLGAAQPVRQVVHRVGGHELARLMMITCSQVCSTSGRMWVLRMMVWSPARPLIRDRVSMICLGSRPRSARRGSARRGCG